MTGARAVPDESDGSGGGRSGQRTAVSRAVIDRRDPAFWNRFRPSSSIIPRDPYFVIDLDTGNS